MTLANDSLSDPQVFDHKDWGITNGESLAVRKKVSIVWPQDKGLDAKHVRGLSDEGGRGERLVRGSIGGHHVRVRFQRYMHSSQFTAVLQHLHSVCHHRDRALT